MRCGCGFWQCTFGSSAAFRILASKWQKDSSRKTGEKSPRIGAISKNVFPEPLSYFFSSMTVHFSTSVDGMGRLFFCSAAEIQFSLSATATLQCNIPLWRRSLLAPDLFSSLPSTHDVTHVQNCIKLPEMEFVNTYPNCHCSQPHWHLRLLFLLVILSVVTLIRIKSKG